MIKKVVYKQNIDCYYKINNDLKRITKLENNEVYYLDYVIYYDEINSYKSIRMNQWKHLENQFFISRDFEWEYNGIKYRTTDKAIDWNKAEYGTHKALIFHNGKIWSASNSGAHYYPKVYLEREKFIHPTRKVLIEKNISNTVKFIIELNAITNIAKWTDIKYCRNFEKIS